MNAIARRYLLALAAVLAVGLVAGLSGCCVDLGHHHGHHHGGHCR